VISVFSPVVEEVIVTVSTPSETAENLRSASIAEAITLAAVCAFTPSFNVLILTDLVAP
jgi:hypothetical protein